MKVNFNYRIDNNKIKLPIQYIAKNKSVYVKKDKNNIIKSFEGNAKINKHRNDEINKNIKNDIDNKGIDNIKEKYDFLLEKTRNLLGDYQRLIEFYQEKEKNSKDKIEDKS